MMLLTSLSQRHMCLKTTPFLRQSTNLLETAVEAGGVPEVPKLERLLPGLLGHASQEHRLVHLVNKSDLMTSKVPAPTWRNSLSPSLTMDLARPPSTRRVKFFLMESNSTLWYCPSERIS